MSVNPHKDRGGLNHGVLFRIYFSDQLECEKAHLSVAQ